MEDPQAEGTEIEMRELGDGTESGRAEQEAAVIQLNESLADTGSKTQIQENLRNSERVQTAVRKIAVEGTAQIKGLTLDTAEEAVKAGEDATASYGGDVPDAAANAVADIDKKPTEAQQNLADATKSVAERCAKEWGEKMDKSEAQHAKNIADIKKLYADELKKVKQAAPGDKADLMKDMMNKLDKLASDRASVADSTTGESKMGEKWKTFWKFILLMVAIGGVMAMLIMMAIQGSASNGCYYIVSGSSAIGPMDGSHNPGVWGIGSGAQGGKCSGADASCGTGVNGNEIKSTSCGCGPKTADTPADNTLSDIQAACQTENGPGSNNGMYPFCCECTDTYKLCSTTYGPKGDTTYQWTETSPADLLGNIMKSLVDDADAAGDAAGGFLHNLFQHLGFLKYILYAVIGMVVLYLFFVLGRFMMEKIKEHKEEKEGENEAREEGENREREREGSERRDEGRGERRGSHRDRGGDRRRSMRLRVR
jgi:hypothetical protein